MAALPIKQHPLAETTLAPTSPVIQQAKAAVSRAMLTVDDESKSQFYGASLGFYKSYLRETFGDAASMVKAFNEFATASDGLAYQGGSGQIPGRKYSRHAHLAHQCMHIADRSLLSSFSFGSPGANSWKNGSQSESTTLSG